MEKWQRINYQPSLPLGENGQRVTGSREHIALSRRAAGEGMVLMKNTGDVLPLAAGAKVALFGKGTVDYVKGGGGSGDVTVAYTRSLLEGMRIKQSEGKVTVFEELAGFYSDDITRQYEGGAVPGMTKEPALPEDLVARAAAFTDTAIITISRFSGEGWDRSVKTYDDDYVLFPDEQGPKDLSAEIFENGDFYLTNAESRMVETVKKNFAKIIVVMNVGGMVDSAWFKNADEISSVLMAWQGGIEGGLAAADVLCGDVNPSGRLSDTFAKDLVDYPSTEGFHESQNYVNYTEDIYVGYRYFETIPGAAAAVNYPFGYGLSYTSFDEKVLSGAVLEGTVGGKTFEKSIWFEVCVTNTGSRAGRNVTELYYSAPQGQLGKPSRVLGAFYKTKELKPGESETFALTLPVAAMASYDDLGKVQKSAYVLETGEYSFYIGGNVRDAVKAEFVYTVAENTVTQQLTEKLAPSALPKRMLADGTYEELPQTELHHACGFTRQLPDDLEGVAPATREIGRFLCEWRIPENLRKPQLRDVASGKMTLDEFLAVLPLELRIELLGGQPNTGVANTFGMGNIPEYGIPNVMTADGPAGLRIRPECGVCTTAWPCATLLACTWDPDLAEEVGRAGAAEVKENNIGVWLTPAVNIHRSPLCGRNFEYYSEDPYLAGRMAAAMVRGIQSEHIGASVKHFAANDKETNRKNSDSRVSERALREIYLKQFEIIVKESQPYTIMSSYNLLNGIHTSENHDLLTGILRDEWGYEGMVTTDWWTFGEHYLETKAGNDIKMANGYPERVKEAYDKGLISEEEINICAKRILAMILKMD